MNALTIGILVLIALLVIGFISININIVPENDIDNFWRNPLRFFILTFFPVLVILNLLTLNYNDLDLYKNLNKKRILEILICSLIGISISIFAIILMHS
jgi:hypothetical protein